MNRPVQPVELSVVTPVYQAAPFLAEFVRRASAAAAEITSNYEIVCVNDGSTDGSLEILLAAHRHDPRVVVIDLSRNFGQPHALRTALAHAKGELVFPIDDDLEEEPEWLGAFHRRLVETKADLVLGVQTQRRGSPRQRLLGDAFYFVARTILQIDCTPNVVTARLMTRRFVDAVLSCPERDFDISLVGHAVGFHRELLPVTKKLRKRTRYSFRRLARRGEDFITAGTTVPLRGIVGVGGLFLLAAAGLGARALRLRGAGTEDWVLASVWFVGGTAIAAVGVVGIYTAKIFHQVKNRPTAVIRAVWAAERDAARRNAAS